MKAGHTLYRGTISGGFWDESKSDLGNSIFTDTNVDNGTTYNLAVTPFDERDFESLYSNETPATPVAPPDNDEMYLPMIFK